MNINTQAPSLYLASGSPRRREILENLGYRIIRLSADIDETPHTGETATDYVARMALEKNHAAQAMLLPTLANTTLEFPLITADTTVALNNIILGKPESPEHAHHMLKSLSDGIHEVMTAVCIYWNNQEAALTQTSRVHFKPLSDTEIDAYIRSGEPMDKAGAYGIQGIGGIFVESLEGSFTGVMGLPVYETTSLLHTLGYPVPPFV